MKKIGQYPFIFLIFLVSGFTTQAARIKDIANVKGVRENVLIGYGIVVGLQGTGDSSTEVTSQSLSRLFGKLGLDVKEGTEVKSKNAAAVIVTAKLPPFSRIGNRIDVSVSSIGDASSLEGGTLLITPLKGGDQNVYAVAQGAISLGQLQNGTAKGTFPTVGRVVAGATIERDIDSNFATKKSFRLSLNRPDFTTAARLVEIVNQELGGKFASAQDSGTIDVIVPFHYEGNTVELMAKVEIFNVNLDQIAKVLINEKTGTVVMGSQVSILPVAIAHGELTIEVKDEKKAVDPKAVPKMASVLELGKAANVGDLVKALNAIGVTSKDLTAIFQTLREVGALQADLEII
jgi:flagellar P-ring protein precursor FlgI